MTTTVNPLKERERLQAEMAKALDTLGHAQRRASGLEVELTRKEKERSDAYVQSARTGDLQVVKDAEEARRSIAAKLSVVEKQRDGAATARARIDAELATLYDAYLDDFAKEAEQLTEAAMQALAALKEPYWRAVEAWHAARSLWAPLHNPIVERIREQDRAIGQDRDITGLHREATAPGFPLDAPLDIFDRGLAPRPPALKP